MNYARIFAASLLAVSALTLTQKPAQAVLLIQDFSLVNVDDVLPGDPFSGSFSYDDAGLVGAGPEETALTSFSFDFLNQSFIDVPPDAEAVFFDGTFLGIELSVGMPGTDAIAFSFNPGFFDTSDASFAYDLSAGSGEVGFADLDYGPATAVPTPALLPGLLGLSLSMVRKKHRQA